jgi:hypothetical protein
MRVSDVYRKSCHSSDDVTPTSHPWVSGSLWVQSTCGISGGQSGAGAGSPPSTPVSSTRLGQGFSIRPSASRPAFGPAQTPVKRVPRALFPGVKRPELEAEHSSPSGTYVKNACGCTYTPPYVFMARCLVKLTDNFIFALSLTLIANEVLELAILTVY